MGRLAALRGSRFHNRRARAGSRGRALRVIRGSVPAGGLMMESRALRADIRAHFWREKIPFMVEKMTPPDLPHLMHPVTQVYKMSDS